MTSMPLKRRQDYKHTSQLYSHYHLYVIDYTKHELVLWKYH